LPASIFVATEFVNEGQWLWPDRLEYALGRTEHDSVTTNLTGAEQTWSLATASDRVLAIRGIGQQFKLLPQEHLHAALSALEATVQCALSTEVNPPEIYYPLTWEQLREMIASGLITVGAHTHRHLILGRCTEETAAFEMAVSCKLLEQHLGKPPTLFAYPNGQTDDFTVSTEALLKHYGIETAVTTMCGRNEPSSANLFTLKRYGQPESPAHLEMLLTNTVRFLKGHVRKQAKLVSVLSCLIALFLFFLKISAPPSPSAAHRSEIGTSVEAVHTEPVIPPQPETPFPFFDREETETASSQIKSTRNR
jgi:Polysaccharide deacetylase